MSKANVQKLYQLAQKFEKEPGGHHQAEEFYWHCIQLEAHFYPAYVNLSALYIQQLDYEKSLQVLEQLFALDYEDAKVLYNLGLTHMGLQDYEQAEMAFEKGLAETNDPIDFLEQLVENAKREKNRTKLVQRLKQLLKLDGSNRMALLEMGLFLYRRKDYPLAQQFIARFLRIEADNGKMLFFHGNCLFQMQQFELAVSYYHKAYENHFRDTVLFYHLGLCYLQLGQFSQAYEEFHKVRRRAPNHDEVNLKLAVAAANIQKYVEAEQIFARLLQKNPQQPLLYYNLGLMYFRNNKIAKGKNQWKQYISFSQAPHKKQVQQFLAELGEL